VTELHVHDWTPWGLSPLSETVGVERRRRMCFSCHLYQDKPTPAGDQPAPKDEPSIELIMQRYDEMHRGVIGARVARGGEVTG
jgi:hypothetical protein